MLITFPFFDNIAIKKFYDHEQIYLYNYFYQANINAIKCLLKFIVLNTFEI